MVISDQRLALSSARTTRWSSPHELSLTAARSSVALLLCLRPARQPTPEGSSSSQQQRNQKSNYIFHIRINKNVPDQTSTSPGPTPLHPLLQCAFVSALLLIIGRSPLQQTTLTFYGRAPHSSPASVSAPWQHYQPLSTFTQPPGESPMHGHLLVLLLSGLGGSSGSETLDGTLRPLR